MKNDKFVDKDLDILSDLEADISRDWSDIHKDIEEKERKAYQEELHELRENPRRFNISYRHFYDLMWEFYNDRHGNTYELASMLREIAGRMLYTNEKLPKAFEHLWDMLCGSREVKLHTGLKCESCKGRYDVFVKESNLVGYFESFEDRIRHEIILKRETVCCPECGHRFVFTGRNSAEIVGIFKHVNFDEAEEYRGMNDIKRKFKFDF